MQALSDSLDHEQRIEFRFFRWTKSWFDLWHTHFDWDGKGNKDWQTRKMYLDQILETFDQLKQKLRTYPHDFQVSEQDVVAIKQYILSVAKKKREEKGDK